MCYFLFAHAHTFCTLRIVSHFLRTLKITKLLTTFHQYTHFSTRTERLLSLCVWAFNAHRLFAIDPHAATICFHVCNFLCISIFRIESITVWNCFETEFHFPLQSIYKHVKDNENEEQTIRFVIFTYLVGRISSAGYHWNECVCAYTFVRLELATMIMSKIKII